MDMRGRKQIAAWAALQLFGAQLQGDIRAPAPAPPQADAQAVRVWRGGQAIITLRGHYAGSGSVSFWIVRSPRHGKLSDLQLLADNRATITYTNGGVRPAAPDDFSYVVRASGNQVSSPAEVRILVEEPPARLRVSGRIEFGEIRAGESATRPLTISNEGGGVLAGRLTSSSPWRPALPNYRVESEQTETIEVTFQPNEARTFVGQITLTGSDDAQATVLLEGTATDPVRVEPNPLQVGVPQGGGAVSYTHLTLPTSDLV